MAEHRTAPLIRALLASASRRLHLAVVGTAVGAALLVSTTGVGGQALPIVTLSLGLLAYAAMVALDVTSPEFFRRINGAPAGGNDPARGLEPGAVRDPELRQVYTRILSSFDQCQHVYQSTSESLRFSLQDGMQRSQELVSVAARAAQRADVICRHLEGHTPNGLTDELNDLQALAARTTDATAKQDFMYAAEAKRAELQTYHQLQGLRDRAHAQLRLIETSLDGLSAKLVKLDATDYAEAISINQSISAHVQTMTDDVEVLESTFEATIQEFRV